MNFIEVNNLTHIYKLSDDAEDGKHNIIKALDDISLLIGNGKRIAILGANGSGKSTLARHFNALLLPFDGDVTVEGINTRNQELTYEIRKKVGMVFQNPDNQIVCNVVEEDIGFGPENICVPTEQIWERVDSALVSVDMEKYRHTSPNKLSGGQKQRTAIAGVIAMCPDIIVLDEATAMLDPIGRTEVLSTIEKLNKELGISVISITHHMEEVLDFDYIYVMNKGKIVMEGVPNELFSYKNIKALREIALDVPPVSIIKNYLIDCGISIENEENVVTMQDLALALEKIRLELNENKKLSEDLDIKKLEEILDKDNSYNKAQDRQVLMSFIDVSYKYGAGDPDEVTAVENISFNIYKGDVVGIIGQTGSGKSTLIRHMNGLEIATSGDILFNGESIYSKEYSLKALRSHVGLVFQYPEYQLFEESVIRDVMFGPLNQGLSKEEAMERAKDALLAVGIEEDKFHISPFKLSGGQKRRVAIAGVLAMKPEMLILDEPVAGLDPIGRKKLLNLIKELNKKLGMTIIIVSHNMEDVAEYTDRVMVMNQAKLVMNDTPYNVFSQADRLVGYGLKAPQALYLTKYLIEEYNWNMEESITVSSAVNSILDVLQDTARRTSEC